MVLRPRLSTSQSRTARRCRDFWANLRWLSGFHVRRLEFFAAVPKVDQQPIVCRIVVRGGERADWSSLHRQWGDGRNQ